MEAAELGARLLKVDVCPRIHSDHHDFRGGGAACGHDSHSGGESTLDTEGNGQQVVMLVAFPSPAHE